MLTLGGSIGLIMGGWVEIATGHAPSTYIFAGMGAFVAGCSRTPITAMFLAFALTKNLLIMKPVLISCIASFLIARACLLYTSPSPRDAHESRMPSSA